MTLSIRRSLALCAALLAVLGGGPAAAQGWCGPHLVTYWRAASTLGDAVMCVRFVDNASFAFYQEGTEQGRTFRRLGYASRPPTGPLSGTDGTFSVRWATINGNGEQLEELARGQALGTVGFRGWDAANPPEHLVWIFGAPAVWRRWSPGRAEGELPRFPDVVKSCGPRLRTYTVADAEGQLTGGIRCALSEGDRANAVWFGWGPAGGTSYMHLGTGFFGVFGARYGASDICRPGMICNRFEMGDLRFGRQGDGWRVEGAWNESWRSVR